MRRQAVVSEVAAQQEIRSDPWLCSAFVLYDHMCTLSREIELVWGRRLTSVTLLFHLNRWAILVWGILNTLDFVPLAALPVSKVLSATGNDAHVCSRSDRGLCSVTALDVYPSTKVLLLRQLQGTPSLPPRRVYYSALHVGRWVPSRLFEDDLKLLPISCSVFSNPDVCYQRRFMVARIRCLPP